MTGNARPSMWFSYVEDTFTMVETKDTALFCLNTLNNNQQHLPNSNDFEKWPLCKDYSLCKMVILGLKLK